MKLTWEEWVKKEYDMDFEKECMSPDDKLWNICMNMAEGNEEEANGYWDNINDTYGDYLAK
jgi:hypothetical protein